MRCITFGSPRVGNAAWKSAYEYLIGATYSVVLEGDPAAQSPTKAGMFKKYVDVGHTLWIHDGAVRYEVRVQQACLRMCCLLR